ERARDPVTGAGLLDPRGGEADVVTVSERFLDERAEDRVREDIPPLGARERGIRRGPSRSVEAFRRGKHGTLVVRAHGAARERAGRGEGESEGGSQALHD